MSSENDRRDDTTPRARDSRATVPADVAAALRDFARRLANFGLGDVPDEASRTSGPQLLP